jgi:phage shock protein PspC (stress-responsive transcriptional regulator)
MEGKRFARSKNAFIFGVCAGLAEYSGISVRAMRFIWIIFAIITFMLAFVGYVVLAVVMLPPDGAPNGDRFWHHVEGRNVMIVFALGLMSLGFYIIIQNVLGINLGKYVFPIALIVAGALFFAFAFDGNRNRKQ